MKSSVIFCLLFAIFSFASSEEGCPDPDDILPCTCTISQRGDTYLQCLNLDNADSLGQVLNNSARYKYEEVHIVYSSLQFLPSALFESVAVSELHLKNVTLMTLFDTPPSALNKLQKLHIENTVLLRGILWEMLQPLKGLKFLEIYSNSIKTLGKDFSDHVTKDIERLVFLRTETKHIQSGVFDGFNKLSRVTMNYCKIEKLTRDILPVPFYGSALRFNYNKLREISDNMFTQMPRLTTVSLLNNQISTLPGSAFAGTEHVLTMLMLTDNPIKCDCRILWLIERKSAAVALGALYGSCESPKHLHGRKLSDVTTGDLHCH